MPTCEHCNETVSALHFDQASRMCVVCKNETAIAQATDRSPALPSVPSYRKLIVTTGLTVPNREIDEVIDIVSAESVIGVNIFKDIAAAWRDVLGGRSKSLQNVLRQARVTCLDELKKEAGSIGAADAIVAIDLDYSEYSSNLVSGGMLLVIATGTAVRLKPELTAVA